MAATSSSTTITHFLVLSARAMRQILVDHFRRRTRHKRGGIESDLPLAEALLPVPTRSDHLVPLDSALSRLSQHSGRLARVVECKFFGGMEYTEIAQALGLTTKTVRRDWFKAKAWLTIALKDGPLTSHD